MVEDWLRSYKPEELFDANGTLLQNCRRWRLSGTRRITANPHANGGNCGKKLSCRTSATMPSK